MTKFDKFTVGGFISFLTIIVGIYVFSTFADTIDIVQYEITNVDKEGYHGTAFDKTGVFFTENDLTFDSNIEVGDKVLVAYVESDFETMVFIVER